MVTEGISVMILYHVSRVSLRARWVVVETGKKGKEGERRVNGHRKTILESTICFVLDTSLNDCVLINFNLCTLSFFPFSVIFICRF